MQAERVSASVVEETAAGVDGVDFRAATAEDAEALSLVAGATLLDAFAGVLPAEAILGFLARYSTAERFRAYLSASRTRVRLACAAEGGAPVGYAMLTEPDMPLEGIGPADLELRRIYLLSRFQGGGAGQRLMDWAIETAGAMGAPRLLLGVYGENHRALRFYERNGFRVVGTRQFQVGPLLCDDLLLARDL